MHAELGYHKKLKQEKTAYLKSMPKGICHFSY